MKLDKMYIVSRLIDAIENNIGDQEKTKTHIQYDRSSIVNLLQDYLKEKDLALDFTTPADGNCLFHAVLWGVRRTLGYKGSHKTLRNEIFQCSDKELEASATDSNCTPQAYRRIFSRPGQWAGITEIALIARRLGAKNLCFIGY